MGALLLPLIKKSPFYVNFAIYCTNVKVKKISSVNDMTL